MRGFQHSVAQAIFLFLLAVMLSACGPSKLAFQKEAPTEIRGEPIASTKASVGTPAFAPAAIPLQAAAPTVSSDDPAYATVGFDKLASYDFEVDEAPFTNQNVSADKANDQIPSTIKALNEKKISIKGFMLPLKVSDGMVTEFLIMKDQSMCCFGTIPKINEWISVRTTGAGVKSIMDQPVSMLGTLHVGALRENGYLVGIYQMDGDHLGAVEN